MNIAHLSKSENLVILLQGTNLRKRFPGVATRSRVDLTLNVEQVHYLVGENGTGKSTLIQVLSGICVPDEVPLP